MIFRLYSKLFLPVVALALVSCSSEDTTSEPVAEVGGAVLTKTNLMAAIPVTSSPADSAVYADEYVRAWAYRQVLFQKAEQYLAHETEDIEAAVDEYRSSLIIETYQNKLVEQKFNSNVSQADIEAYYNEMKKNFVLRDAIIKGMYAVIPAETKDLAGFLRILSKFDDESSLKVEEFLFNHTKQYKTFFDSWTNFASVQKFFPLGSINDDVKALASKPYVRIDNEGNAYILKITEAISAGGQAPMDFVKGDITNILVSQRKLEFLSTTNRELYDQALKDGQIKFYESND